jgi:outer membrane protein OmpA-like peptidoglycan-associated protein
MVCLFKLSRGQNLVTNNSFEKYKFLPKQTQYDTFPCIGWFCPNESTPDFFHAAANDERFSAPNNIIGFHPANNGKGYVAIIPITDIGYMEHLSGSLLKPLEKEKQYKVGLSIRYTGRYKKISNLLTIGLFLSNDTILKHRYKRKGIKDIDNYFIRKYRREANLFELMNSDYVNVVDNIENLLVNKWLEKSTIYTAHGGEKIITIGVFFEKKSKRRKRINLLERNIFKNGKNSYDSNFITKQLPSCLIDNVFVIPVNNLDEEIISSPNFIREVKVIEKRKKEKSSFGSSKVGDKIKLTNFLFEFNKSVLLQKPFPELNRLANFMKEHPDVKIQINGHTDEVGSAEYNKKLSKERAEAVANYLIQNGIRQDRLKTKGFGNSEPIAPNDTEEGRLKNRRVEIEIIKNQ